MKAHARPVRAGKRRQFRLLRYFMATSLIAFSVVGLALYLLQRGEEVFFEHVQDEQATFFADVQKALAAQQQQDAQSGLLAVHETGHVNLTRVFANVLWGSYFAPFVAEAQRLPIEPCRALSDRKESGAAESPRRACFVDLGQRLQAITGFGALDAAAHAMMRSTTVFKIKVFDLRGLTVYSSERAQIGEDKADNAGWQAAVQGRPASELTHRDRFSAFEGVVENRDLISSYIPVRDPRSDAIVGVFEIYSDVTPVLAQLRAAAARMDQLAAANQARVEASARANEAKVHASSGEFLIIVGGLLALLYLALLFVVRNGQRIIDRQAEEQRLAAEREHLWHREKMSALAAMAANVSHEVGNALAVISGHAQELADAQSKGQPAPCRPDLILDQTWRIANMTRRIADFASTSGDRPEAIDLNQLTGAVCEFLRFDRRFRHTALEFRPGAGLPVLMAVPDHLNEALINVVESFVSEEALDAPTFERVVVETSPRGHSAMVEVRGVAAAKPSGSGAVDALRDVKVEAARQRIEGMHGSLTVARDAIWIALPFPSASDPAEGAAASTPALTR